MAMESVKRAQRALQLLLGSEMAKLLLSLEWGDLYSPADDSPPALVVSALLPHLEDFVSQTHQWYKRCSYAPQCLHLQFANLFQEEDS